MDEQMTKTRTANTDRICGTARVWMESHRDYIKSNKFDTDVQTSGLSTWADWVFSPIGPNCGGRASLTADEEAQVNYETAGLVNAIANDKA
jgi:hypothetical protein